MKIAVYGTTLHAGVMAGLFAEYGHQVYWCLSTSEQQINTTHYQEQVVNQLIQQQLMAERLHLKALKQIPLTVDAHFFAFNSNERSQLEQILNYLQQQPMIHPKLMINGSSFGLGGTRQLMQLLPQDDWCYFPDVVQEGNALNSVLQVKHVVVGAETATAQTKIRELLRPFFSYNHNYLFMPILDAEFTKLSISGMLATRISYMNDLAQVAEKLNIDIANVRLGLGADNRIGSSYLAAGAGFGGENFSHDILTLSQTIAETGVKSQLLEQVWDINEQQKEILFRKLWNYYHCDLKGKVIAIWGASFKEDTPRTNYSPIHTMLKALWAQGAIIRLHDPQALSLIAEQYGSRDDLILCEDQYEATQGAEALCVLTAWKQYLSLDYRRLHQLMQHPLILDGRNIYDPEYIKAQGFAYAGVGRQ